MFTLLVQEYLKNKSRKRQRIEEQPESESKSDSEPENEFLYINKSNTVMNDIEGIEQDKVFLVGYLLQHRLVNIAWKLFEKKNCSLK